MEHDIGQLLERIGRGAEVSTLEFETLIHQCRKRKWCDEVTLVLRTMAILGREGIEGAGTIGGEGERTEACNERVGEEKARYTHPS